MTRCLSAELMRIASNEGSSVRQVEVPDWATSVVVQGALDAVGYIAWSRTEAGPGNYDLVVPGSALLVHPIPGESVRWMSAQVIYPGAVPSTDDDLYFIVVAMEGQLAPSVGALS